MPGRAHQQWALIFVSRPRDIGKIAAVHMPRTSKCRTNVDLAFRSSGGLQELCGVRRRVHGLEVPLQFMIVKRIELALSLKDLYADIRSAGI
jgi:hypothetical protein